MIGKKPPPLTTMALANRMGRIAWAFMTNGGRLDPRPRPAVRRRDYRIESIDAPNIIVMTYHYFLMRDFPRKPTPSVATGQQGVADRHCSKGLLDQRSTIFRISSARLVGAAASRTCLHQRRSRIVLGHTRNAAFLTLFNTPSRILVGVPLSPSVCVAECKKICQKSS
ncbi:hypothetical protein [Rhizobium laguerreae]